MNYYAKPISYELFSWNSMSYAALFQVLMESKSRRGLAYRSKYLSYTMSEETSAAMQNRYDINVWLEMSCHIHYYSKQELKKLVNRKED